MTQLPASRTATVTETTFEGLTDKQSRFVVVYSEMGGRSGAGVEAALAAGYGGGTNRDAAKVRASELLRNPKVLEALREELTRRLNAAAVLGVDVLVELAADKQTPPATRLSAAKELVDRGYGPVASRFAHMHVVRSIEDVIFDLDAEEAKAMEADYTMVDPDDP